MLPPSSKTDVNFQSITVYIEGIQVPFIAINVSSGIGTLPTSTISVPPQVSITEISRFYSPKVHVFFQDPIDGEDKLLFNGVITGSNYDKSGTGGASVTFNCIHRYTHLSNFVLDFAGWTGEGVSITSLNPQETAVKSKAVNSKYAMFKAMEGASADKTFTKDKIEVSQENAKANASLMDPCVLPAKLLPYRNRLIGMPGTLVNLWNQFKSYSYTEVQNSQIVNDLYIPLMEDGLKFFERLSGHFYIERLIENDRVSPCIGNTTSTGAKDRLVPSCYRLFTKTSMQAEIGAEVAHQQLQFSGEIEDLVGMYTRFAGSFDYDVLYLTSPAEVLQDPDTESLQARQASISDSLSTPRERIAAFGTAETTVSVKTSGVDVIVKPQLPFYFSPMCNVIYTNMIQNLAVMQEDFRVPTRVTFENKMFEAMNIKIPALNYRAPASIREAIASRGSQGTLEAFSNTLDTPGEQQRFGLDKSYVPGTRKVIEVQGQTTSPTDGAFGTLVRTLENSYGVLGKYEQGRGVKLDKSTVPDWLNWYAMSMGRDPTTNNNWPDAESDPNNFKALEELRQGWTNRYGSHSQGLNPWAKESDLAPYQRLLIASADYEYAKSIASSRAGTVESIFNPYIIPGYPMDIIDSTPNHPSYHAYCTSVSHSISHSSISTTISFVSAVSYTELANYYLPTTHPWLQYALGLAVNQSLVNYDDVETTKSEGRVNAQLAANDFYTPTLGVHGVSPQALFDFASGLARPVKRIGTALIDGSAQPDRNSTGAGELNPMLTGIGNLSLCYRDIEAKEAIERRWGIKFVDMTPVNYNTSVIRVKTEIQDQKNMLEPGQSQWLDYEPFLNKQETL